MQLKKTISILFFIAFCCSNLKAQTSFHTINVTDNDTVINDILDIKNGKSVIFFYPTAKIKKAEFELYSNEFKSNLETKKIDSLKVYFIYFKQDLKNNSKGVKICNDSKDTLTINYMKCFFVGFDSTKLIRAKNKASLNFNISTPKKITMNNIYSVVLEDTNVCIDLVKKIPFYEEIIIESIQPKYSTDEKINQLLNSIAVIEKQNQIYSSEIENLNKIIIEQSKLIDLLQVKIENLDNKIKNEKKSGKNH